MTMPESHNKNAPILSLREVSKRFGTLEALRGVNFEAREGEVIALIGPSGSGKSTLLRCVNGLETPTSGKISYRGQEVNAASLNRIRREIGMVFQRFNLFPHLTRFAKRHVSPPQSARRPERTGKDGRACAFRTSSTQSESR